METIKPYKNMLLENVKTPQDIKQMSMEQLTTLAGEIRNGILLRDSLHGGHVGPNLGFVEATIAMHYVFNAPEDKFVFDVSHQIYPHKMLTGRAFGFVNPERFDEISGYSSPLESPHTTTSRLATRRRPSPSPAACRKAATYLAARRTSSSS